MPVSLVSGSASSDVAMSFIPMQPIHSVDGQAADEVRSTLDVIGVLVWAEG
jgi:hypothetical protein